MLRQLRRYTTVKKLLAVILVSGLVCIFAGCKKQEQKPQLPSGHPGIEGGMPQMGTQNAPKVDRKVVVSKEVKAKWKAVKLVIADKGAKTSKEYTVTIGSDLVVPNTKITIKVLAFLPQFSMSDQEITSKSNEPLMPAAQVLIQEPGKPDWKGWLFSSVPNMHPYEHEKLEVQLAGGVAK
jgi:hypothetical protein